MPTIRPMATIALLAGLALPALPALARTLLLTTDNSQQQIEIIVGPQPGRVKVIGIDGIPSNRIYNGITLIDLRTGTNLDAIEFRMYGTVFPEVRVNTNAGPSDVKFIYDIDHASRVSTLVSVVGGSTNDQVAFEVIDNHARNLSAIFNVAHLSGDNETKVAVNSPRSTNSINVALNTAATTGKDKVTTSIIHRATFLTLDVTAATGRNEDSVITTIDGLGTSTTNLDLDIDLGAAQDVSETIVISRGGRASITGHVRGREGDDLIKLLLEGDGRVNTWLAAAEGDDYIDVELKGAVTGTPRLLGADGQDFLKIVQESRQSTPCIDGGRNIDAAHGFGTIINVENLD